MNKKLGRPFSRTEKVRIVSVQLTLSQIAFLELMKKKSLSEALRQCVVESQSRTLAKETGNSFEDCLIRVTTGTWQNSVVEDKVSTL